MEYLFVYGMFRDAAKLLLDKSTFCGRTTIEGKLYWVNDFYPGFIRDANHRVVGDVYLIDPLIFPKLDEFEGEEYQRIKIKTTTDLDCWVYEYIEDVTKYRLIESGDWMLRKR